MGDRVAAREQARNYLDLACAYGAPTPGLVVVCGLAGTGKSSLAQTLQKRTSFLLLSSDIERKRLAGLAPGVHREASYGEGIYAAEFSARVYNSLMTQAEALLASGHGVIVDATFLRRMQRALVIDLGRRAGVSPIFIECRAPRQEVIGRLIERKARGSGVSDADVGIYLAQSKDFEPLDEIPSGQHLIVDTARERNDILADLERHLA